MNPTKYPQQKFSRRCRRRWQNRQRQQRHRPTTTKSVSSSLIAVLISVFSIVSTYISNFHLVDNSRPSPMINMHSRTIFFTAVSATETTATDGNERQECDADDATTATKRDPQVILNDQILTVNDKNFERYYGSYPPPSGTAAAGAEAAGAGAEASSSSSSSSKTSLEYYILNKEKHVLYIPNFLNQTTIDGLIQLCIDGNRFVRSPLRKNVAADGDNDNDDSHDDITTHHDDHRTSESCTGIPVAVYRSNPKVQAMLTQPQSSMTPQLQAIQYEMDLHWDIATRAAAFLSSPSSTSSSSSISPSTIEPLQLVRYTSPTSQYKLHHDHGGFYASKNNNNNNNDDNDNQETIPDQRPWTMLVFLNTPTEGGHTSFPRLGLEVMPRIGDAIVWSNIIQRSLDDDHDDNDVDVVDPDMVHAGLPPTRGEKYALNVWFGVDTTTDSTKKNQDDNNNAGGDDGNKERLQQQGRWS